MTIVRTVNEQAQTLADYLPNGPLFAPKNLSDSNFRALLIGLAGELFRAEQFSNTFKEDINPSVTVGFIDEWERALGIPDDCFNGAGSLSDRRRDVVIKLASLGVQSVDDFLELADLFGVTVTVEPILHHATFPMTFPIFLLPSVKDARFTILVTFTVTAASKFPLTFPFAFGTAEIGIIECLFAKLKPANCDIIFQQV